MEFVRTARMLEEPLNISLLPPDTGSVNWRRIGVRKEGTDTRETVFDVQSNVHAGREFRYHEVVWRATDPSKDGNLGGAFVRCLRPGDRINLIARAMVRGNKSQCTIAFSGFSLADWDTSTLGGRTKFKRPRF